MSGIWGILSKTKQGSTKNLRQMGNTISHRGKNTEWYAVIPSKDEAVQQFSGINSDQQNWSVLPPDEKIYVALGFGGLRISPSELEQAQTDEETGISVAFDGVIYNRAELTSYLGFNNFKNDTTLLLQAYKKWGIDFVLRLNGMFAIEILDPRNAEIYLVRDHHGTKPLYYYIDDSCILWASEIKAIVKSGMINAGIDIQGLIGTYHLQSPIPPATAFRNTYQLPPASWISFNIHTHEYKSHRYWDIPFGETDNTLTFEEAGLELADRLSNIVKKQTRTHASIVSLLSGGIDSTLITSFAKKHVPALSSYTMALDGTGKGDDELPQAKAMADYLNIRQHAHFAAPEEVLARLDGDIRHMEEPYSDIEVYFHSSKYLSEHGYNIVLNGLGADRLLGGDGYHALFWKWQKMRFLSIAEPFLPPVNKYLKRAKNFLSIKSVWQYFVNSQASLRIFQLQELLIDTDHKIEKQLLIETNENLFRTDTEALFYHDMHHLAAHHTWRTDVSAMRHGLEMRYPFLDPTLTEWVSKLPLDYRYSAKETKPLSREAAKPLITAANLSMTKKGYRLPIETWLEENDTLDKYLKDHVDKLKKRQLFNDKTIDSWWQDYLQDKFQFTKVWLLATTDIWLEEYID